MLFPPNARETDTGLIFTTSDVGSSQWSNQMYRIGLSSSATSLGNINTGGWREPKWIPMGGMTFLGTM